MNKERENEPRAMRKVEPGEKINFQSLKGFPINESKTPDDS